MSPDDQFAEVIAERGREQLLARLRPAFQQAAARYVDQVDLDDDAIEQMVQGAASRADGALWRRSLAFAAQIELGIELGEALVHPAVARAHELAGAPAYEAAATVPEGARAPGASERPPASADERGAPQPVPSSTPSAPAADVPPEAIRLPAVHLGGIGNLDGGEESLELRLSSAGLDIVKTDTATTLGRLDWSEIDALEVPRARGFRRRRRRAQLLVRTPRGEAQFEVPGVSEDELRGYVEPMVRSHRVEPEPMGQPKRRKRSKGKRRRRGGR